ncbi:LPS export ABC transporter periplasmic protein LptC [Sphingomonas sp.]|uniref:LPS export ABC transporter periplasmic protein LptC n=1 Tax=Sphingomonas sp. TaxID=28214 RepID=UPI001DE5746D|nr:LPS export ABC transporter periplasmic protein LptC [Sphingomonas sp.]MBX9795756.1 LPS export ABC transporter periplasmic protein LptC [Sphingomonas sp.]
MSDQALRDRSARRLWARPGSRHDMVVAGSRAGLPVSIGVLAAFLVFMPLRGGGDVSFLLDKNKVEVARERLRLRAATYRGEDQQGRPFVLTADSATQKSSSDPVVQLKALHGEINLADGPADLRADHGEYDLKRDSVAIDGGVRFESARGYQVRTEGAVIDLKAQRLTSSAPVTGTLPRGSFSADRMSADITGRVVQLDGRAHLRLRPGKGK